MQVVRDATHSSTIAGRFVYRTYVVLTDFVAEVLSPYLDKNNSIGSGDDRVNPGEHNALPVPDFYGNLCIYLTTSGCLLRWPCADNSGSDLQRLFRLPQQQSPHTLVR